MLISTVWISGLKIVKDFSRQGHKRSPDHGDFDKPRAVHLVDVAVFIRKPSDGVTLEISFVDGAGCGKIKRRLGDFDNGAGLKGNIGVQKNQSIRVRIYKGLDQLVSPDRRMAAVRDKTWEYFVAKFASDALLEHQTFNRLVRELSIKYRRGDEDLH